MSDLNQKLTELITNERFVGRTMLGRVRKLTPEILKMEKDNVTTAKIEKFAQKHGITVGFETIKTIMGMCR